MKQVEKKSHILRRLIILWSLRGHDDKTLINFAAEYI